MDLRELEAAYGPLNPVPARAASKPKPKGKFWQSLLPSAGGLAGGVGGGALGGAAAGTAILPGVGTLGGALLGALAGGAVGGGAGKVAQNALTGERLGHDVLKSAAIEGGLSAGPLRLAKGAAVAGKAASIGGQGLTSALRTGGRAAVGPSAIKTALAGRLGDTSENLAVKALGLTKGQKNTILEKTGEKAGSIAKRYGVKEAGDVRAAAKPLYDEFNNLVNAIPRQFSKVEVSDAFRAVYEPLLAKGAPLGDKAVGQRLKAEAQNLVKGVNGTISATDLNKKRQAFDKLAYKLKGIDPSGYDVNNMSRKVLAKLVQNAADTAGVRTGSGQTLKQLGREINKLERVGKAAAKNIEGAGGHMALGLGITPGTIIGGTAGLPGALAGAAGNAALNSGAGRRAVSAAADKAAGALTKSAAQNPYGFNAVAGRVTLPPRLGAMLGISPFAAGPVTDRLAMERGGALEPLEDAEPYGQQPGSAATGAVDGGIELQQTVGGPFDPVNVDSSIEQILANGGDLNDVMKYVSLVEALQELRTPEQPKLNATQLQQANNAMSGLEDLSALASMVEADPNVTLKASLPGGSFTRRATGTAQYEAAKQNVADVIGRLRSGGAINQDEEKRFLAQLPQAGDSQQDALMKIQRVSNLLQRFAQPQAAQPDANSLYSALGA